MESKKAIRKKILWLVLFSVAMGFLESAVVVYLRVIYYPDGFLFPLQSMDPQLVIVELLREAATVVMLVGIGILAGSSRNQRLAFFLIAFAVWDLFYYVFLKLILHWPDSFFTWDILFLIPVPWIGPVLTPCLICLTMLLLAWALIDRDRDPVVSALNAREWILLVAGSQIVILSWTWDYWQFSRTHGGQGTLAFSSFVPLTYNWWLFIGGEVLLLAPIYLFWKRTQQKKIHETL